MAKLKNIRRENGSKKTKLTNFKNVKKKQLHFKADVTKKKEGHMKPLDHKKNKIQYEYMKLLRKERQQTNIKSRPRISTDDHDDTDSDQNTGQKMDIKHSKQVERPSGELGQMKQHMFSKAQRKFEEEKQLREKEKQENDLKMEEQRRALQKYRNKKKKRHMMLNKKTHKGQPVMKYQMNYLLEKIKAQVGQS